MGRGLKQASPIWELGIHDLQRGLVNQRNKQQNKTLRGERKAMIGIGLSFTNVLIEKQYAPSYRKTVENLVAQTLHQRQGRNTLLIFSPYGWPTRICGMGCHQVFTAKLTDMDRWGLGCTERAHVRFEGHKNSALPQVWQSGSGFNLCFICSHTNYLQKCYTKTTSSKQTPTLPYLSS